MGLALNLVWKGRTFIFKEKEKWNTEAVSQWEKKKTLLFWVYNEDNEEKKWEEREGSLY